MDGREDKRINPRSGWIPRRRITNVVEYRYLTDECRRISLLEKSKASSSTGTRWY